MRKGLIRKAHLAHNLKKWAAKHPHGRLAAAVPETLILELDDVEYIDEALADAYEVRRSGGSACAGFLARKGHFRPLNMQPHAPGARHGGRLGSLDRQAQRDQPGGRHLRLRPGVAAARGAAGRGGYARVGAAAVSFLSAVRHGMLGRGNNTTRLLDKPLLCEKTAEQH